MERFYKQNQPLALTQQAWAAIKKSARPNGPLLPPLGEVQPVKAHLRVLCQQVGQSLAAEATGRDDAKQGFYHHGLGITLKACRVLQVSGLVPGGNRFDGVGAIPQPLVVRSQIADIGQRMQPRAQHGPIEAEGLGDGFLVLARRFLNACETVPNDSVSKTIHEGGSSGSPNLS